MKYMGPLNVIISKDNEIDIPIFPDNIISITTINNHVQYFPKYIRSYVCICTHVARSKYHAIIQCKMMPLTMEYLNICNSAEYLSDIPISIKTLKYKNTYSYLYEHRKVIPNFDNLPIGLTKVIFDCVFAYA